MGLLEIILIILVILWAIGFIGGVMATPFIHVLLVIALVLFIIRLARGSVRL